MKKDHSKAIVVLCILLLYTIISSVDLCIVKNGEERNEWRNIYRNIHSILNTLMKFQPQYRRQLTKLVLRDVYSINSGRVAHKHYENYLKNIAFNLESMSSLHISELIFSSFQCPDAESISPCVCQILEGPTLDCSQADSFYEIREIIGQASFPETDFKKFRYIPSSHNNNQTILPNNMLASLTFETIIIENTMLMEVEPEGFNGNQEVLIHIHLIDNYGLHTFPFEKLSEFSTLEELFINGAAITNINNLGHIPSLTTLYITDNCIATIDGSAFKNLPSIEVIDISSNFLSNLAEDALQLSWLSKDVTIALSYNRLGTFSPFNGTQPRRLELSANNIAEFTQDVYQPILQTLNSTGGSTGMGIDVRNNPLDCQTMEWVLDYDGYGDYIQSDCHIFFLVHRQLAPKYDKH